MKITNEFTVPTSIDEAWALLTDLQAIAPCMPGAALTGVDGDDYKGKVKIKVGPVVSEFAGTARFIEKSETDHRAAIDAKGRDPRTSGNASATVTAVLKADGDSRTTVSVDTDLKITGKLAQFGSGMIKEVSEKLLAQFVANLEAKLAADEEPAPAPAPTPAAPVATPPAAASGATPTASAAAVGTAAGTAVSPAAVKPSTGARPVNGAVSPHVVRPAPPVEAAEPEPLDLMGLAGGSIYKRLIPVAIGGAVLLAALAWLTGRRRRR